MSEERVTRMSSVLGETGVVIGNVDGVGDLEIRGRVQGSISLNGRILIAETGVVLGNVEATHIAVAGEVRGDLNAKDGVEVQAQGRVLGNVEAPRVGIEAGARVRGMLRTGGELPLSANAEPAASEIPAEKPAKVAQSGAPQDHQEAAPQDHQEATVAPRQPEPPAATAETDRLKTAAQPEPTPKEVNAPSKPSAVPASPLPDRPRRLKPSRSSGDARRSEEKPKKPQRKKGAPPPPTFVKGARGRAK